MRRLGEHAGCKFVSVPPEIMKMTTTLKLTDCTLTLSPLQGFKVIIRLKKSVIQVFMELAV